MRRILKYVGIAFVFVFVVLWVASGYIGTRIVTAPNHHAVGTRSALAGRPVEDVSITTEDGLTLSAWYVPNDSKSAVITLAGIGAGRGQMASTAETYVGWGFSALLPDLRGTGESEGDLVSIGYYERRDLTACARWLREKGYTCVGAHGFSLGAATICFAYKEGVALEFAVIESGYDTMQKAIDRRLDMAYMPHFIGWPYRFFFTRFMGADFQSMSPIEYLPKCKNPTLFLSGDSEVFLTADDTEALYQACGSEKKRLHLFKGGKHDPSIRHFPEESRGVVREFLEKEVGWALAG